MLMLLDGRGQRRSSVSLSFIFLGIYLPICLTYMNSLSFGVPSRLPRVVPKPGAEFNGYYIPEGVCATASQECKL